MKLSKLFLLKSLIFATQETRRLYKDKSFLKNAGLDYDVDDENYDLDLNKELVSELSSEECEDEELESIELEDDSRPDSDDNENQVNSDFEEGYDETDSLEEKEGSDDKSEGNKS